MAKNNFGVRDILENKSTGVHNIGYNGNDITATVNGKPINISTEGFTLGDDNHFTGDIATIRKNVMNATPGFTGVNDVLSRNGRSVYFNPSEQKLYVNGMGFHTDNMINVDGQLMADNTEIQSILDATGFKNPYENMKTDAVSAIKNHGAFSYDPQSDENLKAAQESAMQAVREDYGSRGLLDSSDAIYEGMGKAAALVPQYENMAYQRYQNALDNKYDYLSALQGLENSARAQYQADMENLLGMNKYHEGLKQQGIENDMWRESFDYQKSADDRKFYEDVFRDRRNYEEDVLRDRRNYNEGVLRDRRDYNTSQNVYSDEKTYRDSEAAKKDALNRLKITKHADEETARILGIPVGWYYDI